MRLFMLILLTACRLPDDGTMTVGLLGQSNASGIIGPSPLSLRLDHRGVTVLDNGESLLEYPELVGPEPWIVDELLALGEQPIVVVRAVNAAPLGFVNSQLVPAVIHDFRSHRLTPDVFVMVHGEGDSSDEFLATTYARRLAGPDDGKSTLELLHASYPGVPLVVTEMRHTSDNYGAFHERIRTEQAAAAEKAGVCLVPTADLDLRDKVHYSLEGLEGLGRRVARQIVDGCE